MHWCDKLASKVEGEQIINDSKTPSGRVHVGALRGVLIHDAMFRTLKDRGIPVRYLFGVDDYDPVDELPAGQAEHFETYLGMPLCNVPPPPGSNATDMAEHYIEEFFDVFKELGVEAETYRMRDIYRSGQFNESIDVILNNASAVRDIYLQVSKSERSPNWYPFQVICEQCGRVGTTEVTDYDGKEVTYTCRPDLVEWARGCNYTGKISPFDGNGKLPWKLEWVAKWKTLSITIEGAGKDHNTKGGSRDVAANCLRRIFKQRPPLNIPYEFFLVGGAKMSSSRGLGASLREMADFLPPEVLRFLMIRTLPNRPVNFSVEEKNIIKIFNDFDLFQKRAFDSSKDFEDEKRVYLLSEVNDEENFFQVSYQLIVTMIQLPHLNLILEAEKRKGDSLIEVEIKHLNRRIESARYWLEHHALDEDKFSLQESLPERANELSAAQCAFLRLVADALSDVKWEDDALQSIIFDKARITPLKQNLAFQAIYRVLLDRESGPRAGNLLAFLDMDFLSKRFSEVTFSNLQLWDETALPQHEFEKWLTEKKDKILSIQAEFLPLKECCDEKEVEGNPKDTPYLGVIEYLITLDDQKAYKHRVSFNGQEDSNSNVEQSAENLHLNAASYIDQLGLKFQLNIN